MMKLISGQVMDQERALYGLQDARVASCRFEGPADGESALKECARSANARADWNACRTLT